jgi:hypothetical protein
MAITPSFKTNAEGEEEYIDKGEALKNDYVEWPTDIKGLEY